MYLKYHHCFYHDNPQKFRLQRGTRKLGHDGDVNYVVMVWHIYSYFEVYWIWHFKYVPFSCQLYHNKVIEKSTTSALKLVTIHLNYNSKLSKNVKKNHTSNCVPTYHFQPSSFQVCAMMIIYNQIYGLKFEE